MLNISSLLLMYIVGTHDVEYKAELTIVVCFHKVLYTVEPLRKGHFGTSNFCPRLSLIGMFPSLGQEILSSIQRFYVLCP